MGAHVVEQSTLYPQFLHFLSEHPLLAVVRDQALIYTALWSAAGYVLRESRAVPVFV